MKCWGFARSLLRETKADNTRQIDLLISTGADDVVFEYEAVSTGEKRPLQMLLEMAQPGDTILTLEMRRICSSSQEFMHIVNAIHVRCLRLVILDTLTLDCRSEQLDPLTCHIIQLATKLIELEESNEYRKTRLGSEGIRLQRKSIGRPRITKNDIPQIFFMYYPLYEDRRITVSEFARICQLSRPTIYKYITLLRGSNEQE